MARSSWIHARHMRNGGSLNRRPERQRKGPLRQIDVVLRASTGMFDPAWVELECGHKTHTHGMYRARCEQCAREAKTDA
jgi:hypothetical protein